MSTTFYWHDYETSGTDPARDRPMQFAGIRTDMDLNPIGEPLMIYCKMPEDQLPVPEACMITGIAPQKTLQAGVCEAEFIRTIHQELAQPGTCGVGFNSLRFDDEVTRNALYRNFFDPYEREWQNGCSRWDVIDMLRLARALRPEGINWPLGDDGLPSLRLEKLTEANGLAHSNAHDALSDVEATIAITRLIKTAQPKLYDYVFGMRSKQAVAAALDLQTHRPVIHVSGMFKSEWGNLAVVAPLMQHPTNRNSVICWDLRADPQVLLDASVDQLRQWLFTPRDQLSDDTPRVALKEIHINRCPIVAPAKMLTGDLAERYQVSGAVCREHLALIRQRNEWRDKLSQLYQTREFDQPSDPDLMIYSGGFFSDADKRQLQLIRDTEPAQLGELEPVFQDIRLEEMFLRYKARNYPHTLSQEEQMRWELLRSERLLQGVDQKGLTMEQFFDQLGKLYHQPSTTDRDRTILEELALYGESIYPAELSFDE